MAAKIPKLIYLTGVDGSGKTMFADRLAGELRARGHRVSRLWLRFSNIVSKPLLLICRLAGLSYYEKKGQTTVGYHDFEKSTLVSRLFILFQLIDVWLVTLSSVWPRIWAGKTVVCDRGVYDTLIDLAVDCKNKNFLHAQIVRAFLLPLPRPHAIVYLARDPELIFRSRPDVRHDRNFAFRLHLYREGAEKFSWTVIPNNDTADAVFSEIKSSLSLP